MLLRVSMYRFLSECIFTQKWVYWTICVTFLETAKLFSKVTVRVHYHQQCVMVSCSLIQNSRLSDDKLGLKRWWEGWLTGSLCPELHAGLTALPSLFYVSWQEAAVFPARHNCHVSPGWSNACVPWLRRACWCYSLAAYDPCLLTLGRYQATWSSWSQLETNSKLKKSFTTSRPGPNMSKSLPWHIPKTAVEAA